MERREGGAAGAGAATMTTTGARIVADDDNNDDDDNHSRSSFPPSLSSRSLLTGGIAGERNREKKIRKKEKYLPNPTLIKGRHFHIKNVDGTFLDSEERLASAMLNVVDASRLTLLYYH